MLNLAGCGLFMASRSFKFLIFFLLSNTCSNIQIEAVIGKNDEAVMNFEKVTRISNLLYC